jgi:hypothetical protein
MLLPFIIGVIGGIIVWVNGNKDLGNSMVLAGLIVGFPWIIHIWKKMDDCQCVIHKILFLFRGDYFHKK